MKWLLTCPSDGPNGGEGEALPAAMNVRRKPLNCLAAILKLLQNDSQGTSVVTRMDTPKYDETLKFMYIKNQPILVVTKGLPS